MYLLMDAKNGRPLTKKYQCIGPSSVA